MTENLGDARLQRAKEIGPVGLGLRNRRRSVKYQMVGGDDAGCVELVEDRAHSVAAHSAARGYPDRQAILTGQPCVNLMIFGAQLQRAHVRVEMSRVDS